MNGRLGGERRLEAGPRKLCDLAFRIDHNDGLLVERTAQQHRRQRGCKFSRASSADDQLMEIAVIFDRPEVVLTFKPPAELEMVRHLPRRPVAQQARALQFPLRRKARRAEHRHFFSEPPAKI